MNKSKLVQTLAYIRILITVPLALKAFNALTSFVIEQPYNVQFIRMYGLWLWDIIMTIAGFIIYAGLSFILAPAPVKRKAFFVGLAFFGVQTTIAKTSFHVSFLSIENAIKAQYISSLILWMVALSFILITYRKTIISKNKEMANKGIETDAE